MSVPPEYTSSPYDGRKVSKDKHTSRWVDREKLVLFLGFKCPKTYFAENLSEWLLPMFHAFTFCFFLNFVDRLGRI